MSPSQKFLRGDLIFMFKQIVSHNNLKEYFSLSSFTTRKSHQYKLDFKHLCQVTCIKTGEFNNGEDLISTWDTVHYRQKENIIGKPLTALQKFRSRKRFPPPKSICPSGHRPSFCLTSKSRNILKQWLKQHHDNPYPTLKEKNLLAKQTGLHLDQIRNWFANSRRRTKSRTNKDYNSADITIIANVTDIQYRMTKSKSNSKRKSKKSTQSENINQQQSWSPVIKNSRETNPVPSVNPFLYYSIGYPFYTCPLPSGCHLNQANHGLAKEPKDFHSQIYPNQFYNGYHNFSFDLSSCSPHFPCLCQHKSIPQNTVSNIAGQEEIYKHHRLQFPQQINSQTQQPLRCESSKLPSFSSFTESVPKTQRNPFACYSMSPASHYEPEQNCQSELLLELKDKNAVDAQKFEDFKLLPMNSNHKSKKKSTQQLCYKLKGKNSKWLEKSKKPSSLTRQVRSKERDTTQTIEMSQPGSIIDNKSICKNMNISHEDLMSNSQVSDELSNDDHHQQSHDAAMHEIASILINLSRQQ